MYYFIMELLHFFKQKYISSTSRHFPSFDQFNMLQRWNERSINHKDFNTFILLIQKLVNLHVLYLSVLSYFYSDNFILSGIEVKYTRFDKIVVQQKLIIQYYYYY